MAAKWEYPEARRDESAVDDYHGVKVADPYRWLEDPDAPETVAFVTAQNNITLPYLESDLRTKYIERMKELYNYPKYGCPFQRGKRFFYYYNTGLQNHSVLYMQDALDAEPRVFLDPNTLSDDGTTALAGTSFTEDGSIMAYSLAKGGSDWNTVMFRNVETGEDLPDKLEWVKFSCLSWTVDGKGIFYNKYDPPKKAEAGALDAGTETDINLNQKLMFHRLGTSQDEDFLVYDIPEHPQWMAHAETTEDDKYIVLSISEGCDPVNRLYLADREEVTGRINFRKIVDNFDAQYEYICNDGPVFTFKTNLNAPKYRIIRADLSKETIEWESVVPETEDVLEWAAVVNGTGLVLCYLRHVKSVLELHDLNTGAVVKEFPLDVGSIIGFSGRRKDTTLFFQFTSFLQPGAIYTVDLTSASLEPKLFRQIEVKGFDASLFTCKQVFYPSKDGTKIPMFIVSRKDVVLDGSNPVLLYGYGGFNISIPPSFRVSRLIFSQHMGGILAVANIRGGGEYGETWHKAGTLGNKQNVFDDFQAAAEYLIAEKYTSASKLAIQGGSNGGLLVGACINQRPDLFKVALAEVGVMDMLKFHKFTIGHAWTTDYGCSDKKEDFDWLIKYSPLHNVRHHEDVQYPAVLLLTGDHDDRVVPLHSLKLIATLQHVLGNKPNQTNPLMIRVECKAGHGAGKPTEKVIQEVADLFSFLAKNIGIEWRD